jgi:hypothetical protein
LLEAGVRERDSGECPLHGSQRRRRLGGHQHAHGPHLHAIQ